MAVICAPETFSSDTGGGGAAAVPPFADDPQAGHTMIFMDDPKHKRFRSLVNKGFSARAILGIETELRRRMVALIDALPEGEPFDFVANVSRDLPLRAICLLLGMPQEDGEMLAELVDQGIENSGGEVIGREQFSKLRKYGAELIAATAGSHRRRALDHYPGAARAGRGRTRWWAAERSGARQFLSSAVRCRRRDNAQCHRRRHAGADRPSRAKGLSASRGRHGHSVALEEIMRWTTPSIYKRRTARHDVEFKGQTIKEGDRVTYWDMSANRDERVFDEPFRFDLKRAPNPHLAFGFSAHACLGASLARLEMRIAFQELLGRIETFAPEGPIDWMTSNRLLPASATCRSASESALPAKPSYSLKVTLPAPEDYTKRTKTGD